MSLNAAQLQRGCDEGETRDTVIEHDVKVDVSTQVTSRKQGSGELSVCLSVFNTCQCRYTLLGGNSPAWNFQRHCDR